MWNLSCSWKAAVLLCTVCTAGLYPAWFKTTFSPTFCKNIFLPSIWTCLWEYKYACVWFVLLQLRGSAALFWPQTVIAAVKTRQERFCRGHCSCCTVADINTQPLNCYYNYNLYECLLLGLHIELPILLLSYGGFKGNFCFKLLLASTQKMALVLPSTICIQLNTIKWDFT